MDGIDKIRTFGRMVAILLVAVGCAAHAHAYDYKFDYNNIDPQTEVNGIRYLLRYYDGPYHEDFVPGDVAYRDDEFTLEGGVFWRLEEAADLCQVKYEWHGEITDFIFYDGTVVPPFSDFVVVLKSNTPFRQYLEGYDASKDKMANRYPYYTGDVWFLDSLSMPALPDFHKTKNYLVCYLETDLFNEELTSIRTPRYAALREGMFKNCTGLHTARIGTAQAVETGTFENCSNLGTVFFETAPYVCDDAFKNCPNIKYVVMDGKCPTSEGYDDYGFPHSCYSYRYNFDYMKEDRSPFDEEIYDKATLYVHEDQMEAFRQDKTWGKFKNIRDIEEYMAGVENIAPDTAVEYQIFDLSGTQVRSVRSGESWREGLPAGLYIVKSSLGAVRKELIK